MTGKESLKPLWNNDTPLPLPLVLVLVVVTAIGGAAAANFGDPLENVLSLLVGTLTTLCCIKDSAKNVAGDQGPPRLLFLLLFKVLRKLSLFKSALVVFKDYIRLLDFEVSL